MQGGGSKEQELREESHEVLTTTLVADGAISEVASLGDGHGYLRPDPSLLAVFDSMTAQRQLGFLPSCSTAEQHLSET